MLSLGVLIPRLAVEYCAIIVHYGADANDFFVLFVLAAKPWIRFVDIVVWCNSTGVHTETFEKIDIVTRTFSKSLQDGMIIFFGTLDSCIGCFYTWFL